MPNRGFHQTRSCLRLRLLVGERIQDALVRGILLATCRSLRLLGGLDATEDVERAEILQLLRGQLFTLGGQLLDDTLDDVAAVNRLIDIRLNYTIR